MKLRSQKHALSISAAFAENMGLIPGAFLNLGGYPCRSSSKVQGYQSVQSTPYPWSQLPLNAHYHMVRIKFQHCKK